MAGRGTKRSATVPGSNALEAKRPHFNSPEGMIASVVKALGKASGLSDSSRAMLQMMAPHCLSTAFDQRHFYESAVADMLQQALGDAESSVAAAIKDAADVEAEAAAELARLAKCTESMRARLVSEMEALEAAKKSWCEVHKGLRDAWRTMCEAREDRRQKDANLFEAVEKKQILEAAVSSHLESISNGTCRDMRESVDELVAACSKAAIDTGLVQSFALAGRKAPDARTNFDKIVINSLGESVAKRVVELSDLAAQGNPGSADRETAVKDAEAAFASAECRMREASHKIRRIEVRAQVAESDVIDAEEDEQRANEEKRRKAAEHVIAQWSMEQFRLGPLVAFKKLKGTPRQESREDREMNPVIHAAPTESVCHESAPPPEEREATIMEEEQKVEAAVEPIAMDAACHEDVAPPEEKHAESMEEEQEVEGAVEPIASVAVCPEGVAPPHEKQATSMEEAVGERVDEVGENSIETPEIQQLETREEVVESHLDSLNAELDDELPDTEQGTKNDDAADEEEFDAQEAVIERVHDEVTEEKIEEVLEDIQQVESSVAVSEVLQADDMDIEHDDDLADHQNPEKMETVEEQLEDMDIERHDEFVDQQNSERMKLVGADADAQMEELEEIVERKDEKEEELETMPTTETNKEQVPDDHGSIVNEEVADIERDVAEEQQERDVADCDDDGKDLVAEDVLHAEVKQTEDRSEMQDAASADVIDEAVTLPLKDDYMGPDEDAEDNALEVDNGIVEEHDPIDTGKDEDVNIVRAEEPFDAHECQMENRNEEDQNEELQDLAAASENLNAASGPHSTHSSDDIQTPDCNGDLPQSDNNQVGKIADEATDDLEQKGHDETTDSEVRDAQESDEKQPEEQTESHQAEIEAAAAASEEEQPRSLFPQLRRSTGAASSSTDCQDRPRRFLQHLMKLGGAMSSASAQVVRSTDENVEADDDRSADEHVEVDGAFEEGMERCGDSPSRKRKHDDGDGMEDDRGPCGRQCTLLNSSSCRIRAGCEVLREPEDVCERHESQDVSSQAIEEKTSRDCEEDACENSLQKRHKIDEQTLLEASDSGINVQAVPIVADLEMVPSPARASS
mmetsp:Transcript_80557/g.127160  ORF Transcript_80557/g.127160 Transcript_80557/m.127160 type:complete len:1088 (+) Transcript_80557:90-3353(+)